MQSTVILYKINVGHSRSVLCSTGVRSLKERPKAGKVMFLSTEICDVDTKIIFCVYDTINVAG